jgi:hypothetical protein
MIWQREGAPASIYSGVDIVPVDGDEAHAGWIATVG